jgi:hypothetical protein
MSPLDVQLLRSYLSEIHTSGGAVPGNFHTVNNTVDIMIRAAQQLRVTLVLGPGGNASVGECHAAGALEKLQ